MKCFRVLFLIIVFHSLIDSVYAEDQVPNLESSLKSVFGDKPIEIHPYDEQLKEVAVGSDYYFATHDGRFVFAGQIIDTERRVDIRAERDNHRRQAVLSSHSKNLFVKYPSLGTKRYEVTIFTDIDCPYCRKLHNGIDILNERGVSVNYVMLPRAGKDSASYSKTLSALCSANPAQSITKAMRREELPPMSCDSNQLIAQMNLARDLDISSTPTIMLPDGKLQIGLLSPDQLLALLDEGG